MGFAQFHGQQSLTVPSCNLILSITRLTIRMAELNASRPLKRNQPSKNIVGIFAVVALNTFGVIG
jgi:hypothetical protein